MYCESDQNNDTLGLGRPGDEYWLEKGTKQGEMLLKMLFISIQEVVMSMYKYKFIIHRHLKFVYLIV